MKTSSRLGRRKRWYDADNASPHASVFDIVPQLESKSSDRRNKFLKHARLYGNYEFGGLGPGQNSVSGRSNRLTFNVVANCVDTATALMARSKPAPQFLTSGADYKLARKAIKLNKFGKGVQHQLGIHRLSESMHLDKLIYGTCFAKIWSEGKKLCAERVFPWEILIDEADGFYGDPKNMFQVKYIDRDRLIDMYPECEDKLWHTPSAPTGYFGEQLTTDLIKVVECWHLSGKSGRHVICVENDTLFDEEWTRARFPIVWSHWDLPRPTGFWGGSMVERLAPIQASISDLIARIKQKTRLFGVPRIIVDAASGIPKNWISNEIGEILTIQNGANPPVILTPPPLANEDMQLLQMEIARAYEEVGISQASATARKPTGINSGVGVREVLEIGSERLVMYGLRWEEFHMDVVRVALDEVREIDGFSVDVPGKQHRDELSWADLDLDEEAYVLQCFPVSLLPQTPAGRYERIQELAMGGWITKEQGLELMQVPDMDNLSADVNAQSNSVRQRIDSMIDDGIYVAPEPYDDPAASIAIVKSIYFQERERGAPEQTLAMLRQYMTTCATIMSRAQVQNQAMQQQPTPGAGPQPPTQ